ncbi:MAG: YaiO family outer membrane beta-barrel protein [Terriglobales bacterium]
MIIANLGHYRLKALLLLASIVFTLRTQGQSSPTSPEPDPAPDPAVVNAQPEAQIKQLTNYVETGADYMTLTNGFGSWSGGYSRSVYQQGKNIWNAEITGQHEFGDAGVYFDAGDTYNFNPDWYGALTVGSSAGGFFWPRFRTDGFLNKKWLGRKQLITTLGVSYDMAKDVHRDHTFYLGTTYYFQKPWIVEEGLYFNISHPGAVFAPAGFVAVTQGHNKQQYITVRAGFGEEAYQLIGPTASLSQFNSETLTITWRKWMGPNWGFNFVGDYYHSPFYLRGGSTFGFFKEF